MKLGARAAMDIYGVDADELAHCVALHVIEMKIDEIIVRKCSRVLRRLIMERTGRRAAMFPLVSGALQPASQEAAEFLADLIYTKKYDEKVKSVLRTNFDVNALLELEVLKPIWDKLTKKFDGCSNAGGVSGQRRRRCESRHPPFRASQGN